MDIPEHDIIVVGAGNAATCAALSAKQHGASVLQLEISPELSRGGNSAFTGGAFRIVYHGFDDLARLIPTSATTSLPMSMSAPTPPSSITTTWGASPNTAATRI